MSRVTHAELVSQGGPAFPSETPGFNGASISWPGMTLRDWFAGAAMQGYIASLPEGNEVHNENTAALAYSAADAMLAERAKAAKP